MNLKSILRYRKLSTFLLIPVVIYGLYLVYSQTDTNDVYAVNPLSITYSDGPTPNPMFIIANFLPGDSVQKTFSVKNGAPRDESVEMTGFKVNETKSFASILDIEITSTPSGTLIYSGKLADYFNSNAINIGNFSPDEIKNFAIKVSFPTKAKNEYQNASIIFNIIWRTQIQQDSIPEECKSLSGSFTNVIKGSNKSNHIVGTTGNDLIYAYKGNDTIVGSGGDDCIVGGDGNDKIYAGNGNDIVVAGNGNDKIFASNGDDTIYAGNGNDIIHAGNGNDKIYGEAGNDVIFGENGNDTIDGGTGFNVLFGGLGSDTCTNGSVKTSCEF